MKNIKNLKEDILNKSAGNLFVFNGTEWAIKKHYIDKIAEDYKVIKYLDNTIDLANNMITKGLFKKKTLYVVPHDLEFLKATGKEFDEIIRKVKSSDNGAIWIYSAEIPKTFITHFDEYITDFEEVEDDIFKELILHEISLRPDHVNMLCINCKRNYGMALMEIDKIKSYAQYENVSNDVAFDDLYMHGLLNIEKEKFSCQDFMNHFLIKDFKGLYKSLKALYDTDFKDVWYHLEEMVQDLKIAYCFVKYGKWEGAKRAYDVENLFWGRIKELRDTIAFSTIDYKTICNIPWTEDDLQWLILNISRYDSLVKQGKITDREVIENIFYYLV